MSIKPPKELIPNKSRVSASDTNRVNREVVRLSRSLSAGEGFSTAAGLAAGQRFAGQHFGIYRIESNEGDGEYTVVKQGHSPTDDAYGDEADFYPTLAYDVDMLDTGVVDKVYRGVEIVNAEGDTVVFFSVADKMQWGKATATWTTGNTVTLTPCEDDGTAISGVANITCYVVLPKDADPDGVEIAADDVLAYLPFYDSDEDEWRGVLIAAYIAGGGGTNTDDIYLDAWVNVTQDGIATISTGDWRGRIIAIYYQIYHGTASASDSAEWGGASAVQQHMVGKSWTGAGDPADKTLLSVSAGVTGFIDLRMDRGAEVGQLYVVAYDMSTPPDADAPPYQIRYVIRGAAQKISTDAGTPDYTI
mgnify:CR=1 FL=1